jgi:hypothetical protein
MTFVLTSCGRPQLLKETLDSFKIHNEYPIDRFIVVEDQVEKSPEVVSLIAERYPFIELILTDGHVGQMAAIDQAYATVKTDYIFHCEDDWQFLHNGFITRSIRVLEANADVLQVHLRRKSDLNGHPVEKIPDIAGEPLHRLAYGFRNVWNGFSFNPGVKRLSDYHRIGGSYKALGHEPQTSEKYRELGYYAVVFSDETFVRHIGGGHHIPF